MKPVKPIKPLTFDFVSDVDNHTQIPMTARLVRPNEGYGRLGFREPGQYPMKNDSKDLLVEFYDKRHNPSDDPIEGQFISRYYLSTLMDGKDLSKPIHGLCLDGGIYEWQVDGKSFKDVLTWADNHRQRLSMPRDPDPLTFD